MNIDHDRPYFNMSIADCRRAGTIGGRRSARNRKVRQMVQLHTTQESPEVHVETAREAIELLDRQFPWQRDAERRGAR